MVLAAARGAARVGALAPRTLGVRALASGVLAAAPAAAALGVWSRGVVHRGAPGARAAGRQSGAPGGGGGGHEGRRLRRLVPHHHLLKKETGLRVDEGGEGAPSMKMHPDGLEPLAQAANDVEDEGAVSDDLAQVSKHVRHALHLLAALGYRQIALEKVEELRLKN